jgi:hypothetical protein
MVCDGEGVPAQVASSAAAVHIPPFTPQQGVRIETDPKAASAASGPMTGDDESQIATLAHQLRVRQSDHEAYIKQHQLRSARVVDTCQVLAWNVMLRQLIMATRCAPGCAIITRVKLQAGGHPVRER